MLIVEIGGKKYKLDVTFGKFTKLQRKFYDIEGNRINEEDSYLIESIWLYLKPRWFGIKPFIFKRRLVDKIGINEIREIDLQLAKEIKVEDREGGN